MRNILNKLSSFIIESKRVFQVTKKPSLEEFRVIVKVSGIGILVIGILGFIITIFSQVIRTAY